MLKLIEEKNIEIMCSQTDLGCAQWMHCVFSGHITTLKDLFPVSSMKNFLAQPNTPPFGLGDSMHA